MEIQERRYGLMAEFKWTKGCIPKESGDYLITIKEDETIFTTVSDTFVKQIGEWCCYSDDEIIAYAPLPKPFRPRKRSNKNESKSNNRKTNNKTKS